MDLLSAGRREYLGEGVVDRACDLPDGVPDVPYAVEQMLPARHLRQPFCILRKVETAICHRIVELQKGFVVFLNVRVSRVGFIHRFQQLCIGLDGVAETRRQEFRIHFALLQSFRKASLFLDSFFGHGAFCQRQLFQHRRIGVCLVAESVPHLLPAAVKALFHPIVQCFDGRHKDVVQPVRQLRPCVGGLFLVAEDRLEHGHPF